MKTTVADGVPVQLPEKSIPDAASLEPPSSSGGPPPQGHVPYQATKNRGQPPARHEGAWASNFFKQRASAFQPGRGAQPSPRSRISTVMVSVRRHNTCRGVKLAASKLIRWSPCAFVWARLLFFWDQQGRFSLSATTRMIILRGNPAPCLATSISPWPAPGYPQRA